PVASTKAINIPGRTEQEKEKNLCPSHRGHSEGPAIRAHPSSWPLPATYNSDGSRSRAVAAPPGNPMDGAAERRYHTRRVQNAARRSTLMAEETSFRDLIRRVR